MSLQRVSTAVLIALTALLLGACGKSEPPPKAEDTVFGDLVKQKERAAKETEKAMEQNKQKLEEAMKKNEEGATQ
jgi:hypothetical protein